MPLKADWITGDSYTAAAANAVATAVNNNTSSGITVTNLGNLGSTYSLTSIAASGMAYGVLTANTTITLPSPTAGFMFTLALTQDGTGGRIPTFTGATVDYPAGSPSWVTSVNALNVLEFRAWDNAAWHIFPVTGNLVTSLGNLGASFTLTSSMATGIPFGVLTASTTITLPSPAPGAFTLVLKQNGTGGFTPTFTGATVDYPAGNVSWLTAANALNVLEFRAWDTGAWHIFPATSSGVAVLASDTSTAGMGFVVDEDAMTSNSATKVPTQQSVKAYVDATGGGDASAASVGQNWYQPGYISGQYYVCNSGSVVTTSAGLGFGTLRLSAWTVTASTTITRLFAEHTVLQTGTSFRIGIYNDDGFGRPGTLLLDAGTIDTTVAAAVQEITVSQAITPGLYWVGGAVQGSGTQPTMRIIGANFSGVSVFLPLGTTLPTAGTVFGGWTQTSVSGALPSTLASPALSGLGIARIGFKVA